MSVQINMPQGNNIEQSQTDERRFTRLGWLVIGIGLAGFFYGRAWHHWIREWHPWISYGLW